MWRWAPVDDDFEKFDKAASKKEAASQNADELEVEETFEIKMSDVKNKKKKSRK